MKSKITVLILITIVIMLFSGCTNNNSQNNNFDTTPVDSSWLIDYYPAHTVGNSSEDFWINYPLNNPNFNQSISHLPWVNDSLEEGCVLFVVHKTGCEACKPQADRAINLAKKYGNFIVFHDLDITLGGSIEQRAYDSYLYDPDGSPGLIALTGIFTLIKNNGTIEYAWHSWELDVEGSEMESWIRDAIYYYNISSVR
ncbi:hypothetical protein AYK24_01325 [Thermoplasmatales archaeon SG8-52-4]|nr:MAG: hypothetical protein AYK24_01325 [Thermoplasmatales archaeon SG8-52-4]